jgi:DNA-binding response OmpR family regulator
VATAYRILVIEDERVLAQNLKTFFVRRCNDVRVACDGASAIDMIGSFIPDVLVLDYGLHGISGLETYSEIQRRCTQPVGCVVITGYPPETLTPSPTDQGIRHVLCKPFGLWHLAQLVEASAEEVARSAH